MCFCAKYCIKPVTKLLALPSTRSLLEIHHSNRHPVSGGWAAVWPTSTPPWRKSQGMRRKQLTKNEEILTLFIPLRKLPFFVTSLLCVEAWVDLREFWTRRRGTRNAAILTFHLQQDYPHFSLLLLVSSLSSDVDFRLRAFSVLLVHGAFSVYWGMMKKLVGENH